MSESIPIRDAMIAGTPLKGIEVRRLPIFEDYRGANIILYEDGEYEGIKFVQDNISVSRFNVLRGIHGDSITTKAITCLTGSVYFVILSCNSDPDSPDRYGDWAAIELTDENRFQVLIPPYYGNAHYVQSAFAMFHYKLSSHYHRPSQFTIPWDSPEFGIAWPCNAPILSERDK